MKFQERANTIGSETERNTLRHSPKWRASQAGMLTNKNLISKAVAEEQRVLKRALVTNESKIAKERASATPDLLSARANVVAQMIARRRGSP